MMIEKYQKPLSSIKEKPQIVFSVSRSEIDKLNYYVGKKLLQNQYERNASMIYAEKRVVI